MAAPSPSPRPSEFLDRPRAPLGPVSTGEPVRRHHRQRRNPGIVRALQLPNAAWIFANRVRCQRPRDETMPAVGVQRLRPGRTEPPTSTPERQSRSMARTSPILRMGDYGLPVFRRFRAPDHLMTRRQLRADGLSTAGHRSSGGPTPPCITRPRCTTQPRPARSDRSPNARPQHSRPDVRAAGHQLRPVLRPHHPRTRRRRRLLPRMRPVLTRTAAQAADGPLLVSGGRASRSAPPPTQIRFCYSSKTPPEPTPG